MCVCIYACVSTHNIDLLNLVTNIVVSICHPALLRCISEPHLPCGNIFKEGEDGGVQAPLEGAQGLCCIQPQIPHTVPGCIHLLQGRRGKDGGGEKDTVEIDGRDGGVGEGVCGEGW